MASMSASSMARTTSRPMRSTGCGGWRLFGPTFARNLRAKCYLSEDLCIVTSLSLYDFSQVTNNEMGVLMSRADDSELYHDACTEAEHIIRISDEVRISVDKVETSAAWSRQMGRAGKVSTSPAGKEARPENPGVARRTATAGSN